MMNKHSEPSILNTIQHTDALSLMAQLDDNSIDLALTSPPYDNLRTYTDGHTFDFEAIAQETYRVLKPGGVLVWVVGDATIDGSETLTSMRQALYFVDVAGFKMHDTMIWHKCGMPGKFNRYNPTTEYMFVLCKGHILTVNLQTKRALSAGHKNRRHRTTADGKFKYENGHYTVPEVVPFDNVWDIMQGRHKTTKDKEAYAHPAMFPEKLAERHILTWSNPGDVVLDYFMGSGTTAKMARNNGRNYIGCDISAEYVTLANSRLDKPYTLPMFEEAVTPEQAQQMDMFEDGDGK